MTYRTLTLSGLAVAVSLTINASANGQFVRGVMTVTGAEMH